VDGPCRPLTMASAEREPITGVWGPSPQRGPGAEPLVRRSGGKALEAESFLRIGHPKEGAIKLATCPCFK